MSNKVPKKLFLALFLLLYIAFLLFYLSKHLNYSGGKVKTSKENIVVLDKKFAAIAKVIDGDSLKVGDKEVRLLDIDAPEYAQICYDQEDKEYRCGIESKKFLKDLAHNKFVKCYYAQKDRYQRYLAHCYQDKTHINAAILVAGMAVIYDFSQMQDKTLKNDENNARKAKIGIWQGKFQLPKDYRRSNR